MTRILLPVTGPVVLRKETLHIGGIKGILSRTTVLQLICMTYAHIGNVKNWNILIVNLFAKD